MLQKVHTYPKFFVGILLLLTIFFGYKYFSTASKLKDAESQLADKNGTLQQRITELEGDLLKLGYDKEKLAETFQSQISQTQQSLNDLEKLSKTDPQLLEKYSKVFFLSENYVPEILAYIDDRYLDNKSKKQQIHDKVWPFLKRMLDASRSANVNLTVVSGYRSFSEQVSVKGGYKVTYGAGTANQFSADQGYSEHQLGTAVDLNADGVAAFTSFEKSSAYQWLVDNAYKYGFVLSYPKGNAFYQYEPWHWRFVGVTLATDLHNQGKYFYDMDQRDISKYLLTLFD